MIRPLVLGILAVSLSASSGFGQRYFQPVGQYYASGLGGPWEPPSVAPEEVVPVQYAAPATPFPTPYNTPYPATTTAPVAAPPFSVCPAPYGAPYGTTYPVAQPIPYQTPTNLAEPPPQPVAARPAEPVAPATTKPDVTEKSAEEALEDPIAIEEEAPKAWYYAPVYWLDLWEGNVEIGLSGSEGNSETLNYLLGVSGKRETDQHILDFDLKYDRKTANSIETEHRLFGEIRWELLFEDSCWTWFFHETTEYDEFKAFDVRLSYDTGLGHCLIKNDATSLLARAGAGTSHEVGGLNEDLVPEAVFGLEFKHKLNERQKLSGSSEYSPDVTDFLDYRLKSKASWEVLLDEATNLSLKVSVLDRYDSTPDGKKPNDLDYTLTLLWSF